MPKADSATKHNKFDQQFSNYICQNKIHAICFISRGDQEIVIGEKKLVNEVKANPKITTDELKNKMKEFVNDHNNDQELEFEVFRGDLLFPKLPVKIGSKGWDSETSRKYLLSIFNILGFGKNSFLNYKTASHMPEGFPSDVISWKRFGERGPRGSKIDECTLIVKSLFRHYMGMSENDLLTYYKGCPDSNEDVRTADIVAPEVENSANTNDQDRSLNISSRVLEEQIRRRAPQ